MGVSTHRHRAMIDAPYGLTITGKPRKRPHAVCALCSITAGNGAGVKVFRYPLVRGVSVDGRRTSRCIGSLALCDRCVIEHAALNDKVQAR